MIGNSAAHNSQRETVSIRKVNNPTLALQVKRISVKAVSKVEERVHLLANVAGRMMHLLYISKSTISLFSIQGMLYLRNTFRLMCKDGLLHDRISMASSAGSSNSKRSPILAFEHPTSICTHLINSLIQLDRDGQWNYDLIVILVNNGCITSGTYGIHFFFSCVAYTRFYKINWISILRWLSKLV